MLVSLLISPSLAIISWVYLSVLWGRAPINLSLSMRAQINLPWMHVLTKKATINFL